MRKISRASRALFLAGFCFYAFALMLNLLKFDKAPYACEIIAQILIIAPGLLSMLIHHESVPEVLRLKKTSAENFILAIAVLICSYPVIMILNILSMIFVENAVADSMIFYMTEYGYVLTFLMLAVIPAFCEECLFRGVVFNTYRKQYPLAAVFISAITFGLMHGNLNQLPYAIYLGIVLALMLEATGSIWIPMFMHFCINGFNALTMFASPIEVLQESSSGAESIKAVFLSFRVLFGAYGVSWMLAIYIAVALTFTIGVVALIYLTFRKNHKSLFLYITKRPEGRCDRMIDFWLIAFVLIMIFVFIFFS